MEVENPAISSKGDREVQGGKKVVTFSGTILGSSLGSDCFIDDEEDQLYVFADDMEIDLATTDEKFVPEWDILLQGFKLSRRWVEAELVKEDLEKETLALKCKLQRTPDTEKKLTQLSQDLQAQKEKVKSLTTQNQSSQAAAASASEERDRVATELKSFAESSKKKDEEHKGVLAKMEEAAKKVEDLQATKTWLLTEGAQLLDKNIQKGPEMTVAVAAVNNAMSAIGVNSRLHNGYVHALKKKTPYAEVPLLNRNAEAGLNTAIACFDSLTFPIVNDLPNLVNELFSKIKDALFFPGGESSKE
ncbi:hypothetical protein Hanom_Chr02g00105611 [Helianthus anomalus]